MASIIVVNTLFVSRYFDWLRTCNVTVTEYPKTAANAQYYHEEFQSATH